MKSTFSNKLTALLAGVLSLSMLLSACTKAEPTKEEAEASSGTEQAEESSEETRVIIDQMGNEVVLPKEVNRVVITSAWPLASVYCLFEGNTDKLVGLDPAIISAAENSLLVKAFPEITHIESGFSVGGQLNAEELIKLDPDVILYASGAPADYEVAKQAGIPAVGFSLSIKDFNAVDTINSWMELLGEIFDKDISNSEFIEYGQEMQEFVAERLSNVKEEDKPTNMFIHKYDAAAIKVPALDSWADYWITASGGINVAAEAGSGFNDIGIEQIYEWNPEKIFITNFNEAIPEDLYGNSMETFDWKGVEAVRNKEVHKLPLGMYRWYVTCSDSSLMLLWMAKQNHPDLFEDVDMNEVVKEFYQKFYNLELTDEEAESIFVAKREAAGGIK